MEPPWLSVGHGGRFPTKAVRQSGSGTCGPAMAPADSPYLELEVVPKSLVPGPFSGPLTALVSCFIDLNKSLGS